MIINPLSPKTLAETKMLYHLKVTDAAPVGPFRVLVETHHVALPITKGDFVDARRDKETHGDLENIVEALKLIGEPVCFRLVPNLCQVWKEIIGGKCHGIPTICFLSSCKLPIAQDVDSAASGAYVSVSYLKFHITSVALRKWRFGKNTHLDDNVFTRNIECRLIFKKTANLRRSSSKPASCTCRNV